MYALEKVRRFLERCGTVDLGIGRDDISNANRSHGQTIGGAVEWLEHEGSWCSAEV